jgi:hypothetical protein
LVGALVHCRGHVCFDLEYRVLPVVSVQVNTRHLFIETAQFVCSLLRRFNIRGRARLDFLFDLASDEKLFA